MYNKDLVPWTDDKTVDKQSSSYLTNMLKLKRGFCSGKSESSMTTVVLISCLFEILSYLV